MLTRRCRTVVAPRRGGQRGLSIVEMMVGVAVGLIVVAGAALTVSNQLVSNRQLLIETQVQQDLRAAADIVTRELRRAGSWDGALSAIWTPTLTAQPNPFTTIGVGTGQIGYRYRRGGGTDIPYGFKLESGTLKSLVLGASGYQELTDPRVLRITAFTITPTVVESQRLPCPRACADGTDSCWPTLTVRDLEFTLTGQAVSDPAVTRSIRSTVRVRNDWIRYNDAANPALLCPP